MPEKNKPFVAGATIVYKVSADGLSSAFTMAHIHAGAPGTPGPVVVPLQLAATPGGASGEGASVKWPVGVGGKGRQQLRSAPPSPGPHPSPEVDPLARSPQ